MSRIGVRAEPPWRWRKRPASQAKRAPNATEIIAALEAANHTKDAVEKAGWATPVGKEKPNDKLAVACSTALAST
jgi:hypothetical protein